MPDGYIEAELGATALRRLRAHATAQGKTAEALAADWLVQRLQVEEATRRARGAGAEQLLRLVRAIEDVDPPGGEL